jgi:hypothetical protein
LVDNLKLHSVDDLVHTKRHFGDQFHLVTGKGIFPYEYMTDLCKLDDNRLPPIEAFYSSLTKSGVTEAEYTHAQRVWTAFNMTSMRDYQNVYVTSDVLLLADVFEAFRRMSLKEYKLDPAHFYTTPGLSFQACLKMTGVHLELLTDHNMLLMVENGIRGGTSMISCRESTANNKYVPETFDSARDSTYIAYLDANNLYGYAMSCPLPVGEYTWLSRDQIAQLDIMGVAEDADYGYILEVDLDYPARLHDSHNCYPLAVERVKLTRDMLSPTAVSLNEQLGRKYTSSEKLVPNLNDKTKYVVHYRNLQLYLHHGMVLCKIHQVIKFRQTPWLEPYISKNTDLRKMAKSTFEKDFFKLLNNSMYGKTMENLRNRIDVKIVSTTQSAEKQVAKVNCRAWNEINDHFAMVNLHKLVIHWDKPTIVGCTVLELSKLHMYNFHYNIMKPRYGDRLKLLFTDTDSFCYQIKTADFYGDMKDMSQHFDTSDYLPEHPLHSKANAKVIGKFKDECNGVPAVHFVGLRAKMYSLLQHNRKEKATAKGVGAVAQRNIHHADYVRCLRESMLTHATFDVIRSRNHALATETVTKVALSPFDDKRYLLPNSPDTLAYGHYKICQ